MGAPIPDFWRLHRILEQISSDFLEIRIKNYVGGPAALSNIQYYLALVYFIYIIILYFK